MDEFKKHIFKTCFGLAVVLGLLAFSCGSSCGIVYATGIEEEAEVENTLGDEEVVEENTPETDVQTPEEVVPDAQIDNAALLDFAPLSTSNGELIDFEDLYNVLVHIYNFMLMSFIVGLIIWTYNTITKAFRRFIY